MVRTAVSPVALLQGGLAPSSNHPCCISTVLWPQVKDVRHLQHSMHTSPSILLRRPCRLHTLQLFFIGQRKSSLRTEMPVHNAAPAQTVVVKVHLLLKMI